MGWRSFTTTQTCDALQHLTYFQTALILLFVYFGQQLYYFYTLITIMSSFYCSCFQQSSKTDWHWSGIEQTACRQSEQLAVEHRGAFSNKWVRIFFIFFSGVGGEQNRTVSRVNIGHPFMRWIQTWLYINANVSNSLCWHQVSWLHSLFIDTQENRWTKVMWGDICLWQTASIHSSSNCDWRQKCFIAVPKGHIWRQVKRQRSKMW